jgi:V8-like Glu-specific endopeptidase
MKKTFLITSLTAVLMLGGALVSVAGMLVSASVDEAEMMSTEEFWTPARMKAAKPYPIPTVDGDPLPFYQTAAQVSIGNPAYGPSADATDALLQAEDASEPISRLLSESERETLALAAAVEPMANGYDVYPPPQNTFYVWLALYGNTPTRYSRFPYSASGKVFFTKGGLSYVCSGSTQKGSAVLTAGHCVSNGRGTFHTRWSFVPSYKNGARPFGTWYARRLATFSDWHTNGWRGRYGRDVGYAIVSRKSGRNISSYTGYVGIAVNQSRYKLFNVLGYPSASPYVGKYLVRTEASTARIDCRMSPCTDGVGTRQTPGASGGPWLINFRLLAGGAANLANGVNSYIYTSRPRVLYSPYFDSAVLNFWKWAVGQY